MQNVACSTLNKGAKLVVKHFICKTRACYSFVSFLILVTLFLSKERRRSRAPPISVTALCCSTATLFVVHRKYSLDVIHERFDLGKRSPPRGACHNLVSSQTEGGVPRGLKRSLELLLVDALVRAGRALLLELLTHGAVQLLLEDGLGLDGLELGLEVLHVESRRIASAASIVEVVAHILELIAFTAPGWHCVSEWWFVMFGRVGRLTNCLFHCRPSWSW